MLTEKSSKSKRVLNVSDGNGMILGACYCDSGTHFGSLNNFSYFIDFLVDAESTCNTSFNSYEPSNNNNFLPLSLSPFYADDVFAFSFVCIPLSQKKSFCMWQ